MLLLHACAEEKRRAAMEAAARQEREARASAAVAKLERLKAGWKENQVLQAAAAAGDSSAVGKKKVRLWHCTWNPVTAPHWSGRLCQVTLCTQLQQL